MNEHIYEPDWKHLCKLREVALIRFHGRTVAEMQAVLADTSQSFAGRYEKVRQFMDESDAELNMGFAPNSRSMAKQCILFLTSRGLITEKEFLEFSESTTKWVALLLDGEYNWYPEETV